MKMLSIIIPVYNIEKYILRTLQSIMINQLDECELILVDDGSTDRSIEIAQQYLKQNATCEYRIIQQLNQGVSAARNTGIKNAKGQFIMFCDGDDYVKQDFVKIVKDYLTNDTELVIWRYEITQKSNTLISQEDFEVRLMDSSNAFEQFVRKKLMIRIGSFAVRRDIILKNNLTYTENCKYAEDVEYIMKCLAAVTQVSLINNILFVYAKHSNSAAYSYNICRFDAPEAIERVYEYVQNNKKISGNRQLMDYLHDELYILHTVFSFDACISYLSLNKINLFYRDYRNMYPEIENKLQTRIRHVHTIPTGLTRKKLLIFKCGRRFYTYIYLIRNICAVIRQK